MDRLRASHVIGTYFRLQHEYTDTDLGGQEPDTEEPMTGYHIT